MRYVTMVKVKFRDEESFRSFVDLIQNKLFCSKEIDFCICDNDDDDSPKSEEIESPDSAESKQVVPSAAAEAGIQQLTAEIAAVVDKLEVAYNERDVESFGYLCIKLRKLSAV